MLEYTHIPGVHWHLPIYNIHVSVARPNKNHAPVPEVHKMAMTSESEALDILIIGTKIPNPTMAMIAEMEVY